MTLWRRITVDGRDVMVRRAGSYQTRTNLAVQLSCTVTHIEYGSGKVKVNYHFPDTMNVH